MTKGRNGNKNCRQDGGHSTLMMMHGIAMTLRWLIGHLVVTFTDSNHLKKTPDKQEGKSTSSINMRERERERRGGNPNKEKVRQSTPWSECQILRGLTHQTKSQRSDMALHGPKKNFFKVPVLT